MKLFCAALFLFFSFSVFSQAVLSEKENKHLSGLKQLTYGGDNAEAYFSFNDKFVSFQSNNKAWGNQCDQIYALDIKKAAKDSTYMPARISNGKGRTTCSYFLPDNKHVLFASTFMDKDACPTDPPPRADHKYLWAIYSSFDIYIADLKGNVTKRLTDTFGYDAEATISPDGKKIVFTSTRSGDLELWIMNTDGTGLKQITNELGYDGGAFFSPDSKQLVFRASRPKTTEEITEYKELLGQYLVAPTNMEIYTVDTNGQNLKQVTTLGKANWAPFFTPDGKKIIFSSNHASKRGYDFNLYTIKPDGTELEQITTESNFNAFPMFSRDGKKLIWSSNRNNHGTRDTNLFIADWKN